jgi:5-methylcytosine-specific restriction endonuclease McrA
MFKPFFGICSQCDNEGMLVVKKLWCARCNHENKQKAKKAAGKKVAKYQYVREATGEGEMMRETVLNMLGDEATRCFVCGIPIAALTYSNMSHVLPKGKYPEFRLKPENLKVLCHKFIADENGNNGCHQIWDFRPRSYIVNDPMWQEMIELETQLKEEYSRIKE